MTSEAFVSISHQVPRICDVSSLHSTKNMRYCERRPRVELWVARSLDSYREGMRRSGGRREKEYSPESSPRTPQERNHGYRDRRDSLAMPARTGGPRYPSRRSSNPSIPGRISDKRRTSNRAPPSQRLKHPSANANLHGNVDTDGAFDDHMDDDDEPFKPAARPRPSDEKTSSGPPKTRISLIRALVRGKVSTSETCGLLLRGRFIRVNGVVKDDPSFMVDLLKDTIAVNGRDLEFPTEDDSSDDETSTSSLGDEENEASLTRTQKDFRRGRFAVEARQPREKNYSRQIDGGFYASRRWQAGK